MELTEKIFRDLAHLAQWYIQFSRCQYGSYSLEEIIKEKTGKFIYVNKESLAESEKPSDVTWDEVTRECSVNLSYNNLEQKYSFSMENIYSIMFYFSKIAKLPIKEKKELCTLTKKAEIKGELIATVELPSKRMKDFVKAVSDEILRPYLQGVYIDKEGYIVATNCFVMNVCRTSASIGEKFKGAILPKDFAARHDGQSVSIYDDEGELYAVCGEETVKCIEGIYPDWRNVLPIMPEKGRCKVSAKDVKKAVNYKRKDKGNEIAFRFHEGLDVLKENKNTKLYADHDIHNFEICTYAERLDVILPECTEMYVKDNMSPFVFVGEGCLSLVMQSNEKDNEYMEIPNYYGVEIDLLSIIDAPTTDATDVNKFNSDAMCCIPTKRRIAKNTYKRVKTLRMDDVCQRNIIRA